MTNYLTLREANIARQEEWDPGEHAKDWSWRCNELAGEAGEVCNILKKLHRERLCIPGSRATKDQLAEELADVIICVDLCAMQAMIEPRFYGPISPNAVSLRLLTEYGCALSAHVGHLCASVAELDEPPAFNRTNGILRAITNVVRMIAHVEKIDLGMAVLNKFNATSAKVGLKTTLNYEEPLAFQHYSRPECQYNECRSPRFCSSHDVCESPYKIA